MKNSIFFVILFCVISMIPIYSEEPTPQKYTMVEIKVSLENMADLQELGFPLDCCGITYGDKFRIFTVPLNETDMATLQKSRFSYRVVVEDVAEYYASRNTKEEVARAETYRQTLGTEMQLGSMGGAYKIEEIAEVLDKLYAKYGPKNRITQKVSIGKSYEGRDIWMVKISDNANTDEGSAEPQVLFTALTHAREPGGMMTLFYYMYYLLENYDSSERVRNIVDNREIFFVPVVNPDGYAYNQKNSPNGGGMHRKNRNGSGIDLNRNFGPDDMWNYPNGGSSTSSWSETYRGTSAFSEKETQVLRDFAETKKFRTALNYHTYSNLLIYPWGIKDEIAHPMFKTMAVEMTRINGYSYGTAQGLLYAVRGVSDDYFYKVKGVFSMTPEAGGSSDGFWPSASRYFPLAQENLEANLLLSEYAGQVK